MKTLFTILTLGFGLSAAHAQKVKEGKVPGPVKEAFSKQYPGAKVKKWKREDVNYEAEFQVNQVETQAVYDSNGNFIESEIELKKSDLPKAVTDFIRTNLHGKKIKEAAKIMDATGKVTYKAEINREYYIFDSDCLFVRKDGDKD